MEVINNNVRDSGRAGKSCSTEQHLFGVERIDVLPDRLALAVLHRKHCVIVVLVGFSLLQKVPLGILGDDILRMIDKEIPKCAERLQLEPLKGHYAIDYKCDFSRQHRDPQETVKVARSEVTGNDKAHSFRWTGHRQRVCPAYEYDRHWARAEL